MSPLHATLHWLQIPAACVGLLAALWIAVVMIWFVRGYRPQTEAVGGVRWPRLWYWYAAVMVLFGAVLLVTAVETSHPAFCLVAAALRIISVPVLLITAVLLTIGTRDARRFWASPNLREDWIALRQEVARAADVIVREVRGGNGNR